MVSAILKATPNLTQTSSSDCQTSRCWQDRARSLLKQNSVKMSLAKIQAASPAECHSAAHFLGQELYRQEKNAPHSFAECDGSCLGGCFHGVIEGYLNETGQELSKMDQVCKSVSTAESGTYQDCLHGLGHGLMALTGNDLLSSLSVCDQFSRPDFCYLGVFMENTSSPTNPNHPTKFIKASDPLYPCNDLPEKYAATCFTNQSNYFLTLTNYNWAETTQLCLTVPSAYRSGCISYVGGNLVFYNQANQIDKVCGSLSESLARDCLVGAREARMGLRKR